MNPTLWLLVTRLQLPLAPRDQGTGCITRRLPAARPPGAGHKGRFVPGVAESRSRRGADCGPPRALGAGARGLGQQTGRAVYTGRLLLAREGTGGRRQPSGAAAGRARGGARSLKAPPRGCPRGRLPPSNNCPGPCPSKTPAGGSGRHEVSFCTAGGVAYLGAGARARKARGGRRTGARGPAAWWGARLSGCAGCGLRGGVRPGSGGGGPGASAGREAGAAALAGAPPPPSLPQPSPPSPGAAAAPARRLGRPGCRRSGQPRRAVWAEAGQQAPRCGRDSGSATRPGPRLPRAPANSCQSPPPLPFLSSLRPAGLHFPPLLTPPLLSPSRPPPGCHTVR